MYRVEFFDNPACEGNSTSMLDYAEGCTETAFGGQFRTTKGCSAASQETANIFCSDIAFQSSFPSPSTHSTISQAGSTGFPFSSSMSSNAGVGTSVLAAIAVALMCSRV